MPIWKLVPAPGNENHWRASKYVGPLFVRAPDEVTARGLAQSAFGIAPVVVPGAETPLMPWVHDWIASCEQVGDSEYDEEGPDDILGPEKALARAHPRPW